MAFRAGKQFQKLNK